VAGQGLARLRHAGIAVEHGLLEAQARGLNPGFIKRMEQGLPYVRCKLAMSLDGRTAMASGESKWITSEAARRDVQRLRARSSAIVTGLGTVLADDPSMNVRIEPEALSPTAEEIGVRQPMRVVLDPGLDMSAQARMLKLPGETLVLCTDAGAHRADSLESAGARVVTLPGQDGHVDLEAALLYLAREEINEVLLETGATLAGAALALGLIDELIVYLAPHILGHGARGLFNLPGLERMRDRIELEITDVRAVGLDWRITARPRG
jgi:diaminohydroxyphosphoribosylaminopyrimidine deaminase/5-amino-6-(5-phosphoribosylamino)uracil reductase